MSGCLLAKKRQNRQRRVRGNAGRAAVVRSTYDAAQNTPDNMKHWLAADLLGPIVANNPATRKRLRARGRYEYANSCWCHGMIDTLALYTVGSGPRLQILSDSAEINSWVEQQWSRWAGAVRLAATLRQLRIGRAHTGECFLVLGTNPRLRVPVKLDPQPLEADRVASPYLFQEDPHTVDGIRFDEFGHPVEYSVLDAHPGETPWATSSPFTATVINADRVLHYFQATRPGQRRGIPDITPSLPLYALIRRHALAVLGSAESAARFTVVLETQGPADYDDVAPADDEDGPAASVPMDTLELEQSMATILPDGYKLGQVKAEQPVTTHADFVRIILNEIARALGIPLNIAMGNSGGFNYASGRLDQQVFFRQVEVEQADLVDTVLEPLFRAWMNEAVLIEGFLPQQLRTIGAIEGLAHDWQWDGYQHVDPAKEANAQKTRLASGVTNLAIECARDQEDWEEVRRQRGRELALDRELGLLPTAKNDASADDDDEEGLEDAVEEALEEAGVATG